MIKFAVKFFIACSVAGALLPLTGCTTLQTKQAEDWPVYELQAEQTWLLNCESRPDFGASGLLLTKSGDLLTLNDREPTLYQIVFPSSGAIAALKPLTNCYTPAQLAAYKPSNGYYDCEGIAQDRQGRFYVCEEGNRWILRCDPRARRSEVLPIDWTPVQKLFSSDRNASFEGIAIGNDYLYVANERSSPVIIAVDLHSLKVTDHFVVTPRTPSFLGITHYSDLSWADGNLWVLCRHHRVVLEVEPATHRVLAEFYYRQLEDALGYKTAYPTGVMEGLAVDRDWIWLATDNNGLARKTAPQDARPTLVKCRRPDRNRR